MFPPIVPRLVLASVFLLLGATAIVPTANAEAALPCSPYLPLWDDAMCAIELAGDVAQKVVHTVECDIIGGPACGITGPIIDWG